MQRVKNVEYGNTILNTAQEEEFINQKYAKGTLKSLDLALLQYDICVNVEPHNAQNVKECLSFNTPFVSSMELTEDILLVLLTSFRPIDKVYKQRLFELIDESSLYLQTQNFSVWSNSVYHMMCAINRKKEKLNLSLLYHKHKIIHPIHTILVDNVPHIVHVGIRN